MLVYQRVRFMALWYSAFQLGSFLGTAKGNCCRNSLCFFCVKTYYSRTWYIHHEHLPRNAIPRILEFHEDWRRWEGDLLSAWHEFIVPNEVVEYHIAQPDPYRGYMNWVCHADVIISQGVWAPRFSGLITVHCQSRHSPPLTNAVAVSFGQRVSGVDIVTTADSLHWCNDPG